MAGLGYVVTRLSGKSGSEEEGFQGAVAPTGSSAQGTLQELDLRYQDLMGRAPPPSEPNPGLQGTLLTYAPPAPRTVPMNPSLQPHPEPINAATPDVAMNPAGIEAAPVYVEGDYMVSQLTGERIAAADFTHNNMVPYFGGRVRQNVNVEANVSRLDDYTGAGSVQIAKKEVEPMFNTAQTPYGNPFGLEAISDFVESRIEAPRSRAGERPFEPVRVGPEIGRAHV